MLATAARADAGPPSPSSAPTVLPGPKTPLRQPDNVVKSDLEEIEGELGQHQVDAAPL